MIPNSRIFTYAAVFFTIAAFCTGCENAGEARELPRPDVELTTLFDELSPANSSDDQTDSRIEELMARNETDDTARAVQRVALGASLVSEIPDDSERWTWSRKGSTTLISFAPAGEAPQALVVSSRAGNSGLSRQFQRFLADVDPTLAGPIDVGALQRSAQSGQLPVNDAMDGQGQVDIDKMLAILSGGPSLTGGRGLGYRSHPKSFSGWHWIGENDAAIMLRLATTDGRWGPQPPTPPGMSPADMASILEGSTDAGGPSALDSIAIDNALSDLRQLSGSGTGGRPAPANAAPTGQNRPSIPSGALASTAERPARLIVGEVVGESRHRVHLAILCSAEPTCPVAADLAAMLANIRVADSPASRRPIDFDEHLQTLGLQMSPAGSPPSMPSN